MKKNTKIIIIGFGSIGRRHYQNLKQLGYTNIWIYDSEKKVRDRAPKKILNLTVNALTPFTIAFICSPNHLHIRHALVCARAGCHLFIEKPLSHSLKDIKKLQTLCRQKRLIHMVACNMRFHPCLRLMKDYLMKKKLGAIYSIAHEFGYYLPFWRPKQNYRTNYAAKRLTGGGIILDDIHEFDLLFWLNDFSPVIESSFIYGHVSNLQIKTEDTCVASFKFKNNVIGSVRCDYLQKHYARSCKIIGEHGSLTWDFNDNRVLLGDLKGVRELYAVKNYETNSMYLDEVKYFLTCVTRLRQTVNTIDSAKIVLSYCIKRS